VDHIRRWPGFWLAWLASVAAMALGVSPAHADDAPVPTYRQASRVVVITIEGEIDKWMYESVKRRMAVAEHNGADALVFEINSPGGEVLVVNALCELIKQGPIQNTVAWVNNEAYSGGAIVALACREIVMNAAAQMGAAMPVAVDPILSRLGTVDTKELQRKILPPLLANVLDSARRHNEFFHRYQRDEFLVQSIILNDLSLWWVEDTRSGQRMAIDRREFEMLFPGVSPDGPAALASGTAPAASGSLSAEAAKTWDALRPLRDDVLPKAHAALSDLARLKTSDPAAFATQRDAVRATLQQARSVLEPLTTPKMPLAQAEQLLEALTKIEAKLERL
jgi:hypothetical protein